MSDPKPWHRRKGETARAYAAFTKYLALGPERTVREAYRQFSGRDSAALTAGYFNAWSSANDWVARADAHDTAELERAIERRAAQRERVRQLFVDAAPNVARRLLRLATEEDAEFAAHHVSAAKLALAHAGLAEGGETRAQVEVSSLGSDGPRVVVTLVSPDNGRGPHQGE